MRPTACCCRLRPAAGWPSSGAGPAGLEAARVGRLPRARRRRVRAHGRDRWRARARGDARLQARAAPDDRLVGAASSPTLGVRVHLDHEVGAGLPRAAGAPTPSWSAAGRPRRARGARDRRRPASSTCSRSTAARPSGRRVVVCGGGLSGVDSALELAQDGHEVTVVEMAESDRAHDGDAQPRRAAAPARRARASASSPGTWSRPSSPARSWSRGLTARSGSRRTRSSPRSGCAPTRSSAEALAGRVAELHVIGDAVQPAKVAEAVHAGFRVGMAL